MLQNQHNCTKAFVNLAIDSYFNSCSSLDDISFRLLKTIKLLIILPLTIFYQHSLFEGCFSHIWMHAIVTPVYKGRGGRILLTATNQLAPTHALLKFYRNCINSILSPSPSDQSQTRCYTASQLTCLTSITLAPSSNRTCKQHHYNLHYCNII